MLKLDVSELISLGPPRWQHLWHLQKSSTLTVYLPGQSFLPKSMGMQNDRVHLQLQSSQSAKIFTEKHLSQGEVIGSTQILAS